MDIRTLTQKYNDGSLQIDGASYVGKPRNHTIMYVSSKIGCLVNNLIGHRGCVVFAENGITIKNNQITKENFFIFTNNPQLDYANFAAIIETKLFEANRKRKFTLEKGGYYVGENTVIGDNAYIEPGCFIGHGVVIGSNACILSGSRISNSIIGDNFICNENAVIGNNSFTMANDGYGNKIRIPALGRVVIGNNVEVGVCNDISRGACGDTILEDYVKLDGLVHIGHEAHLYRNVEVTAGAIIGGFVEIGEHGYLGVNTSIRNRISLGNKCLIGMGAVVTKTVENNIIVVGNPAKPFTK